MVQKNQFTSIFILAALVMGISPRTDARQIGLRGSGVDDNPININASVSRAFRRPNLHGSRFRPSLPTTRADGKIPCKAGRRRFRFTNPCGQGMYCHLEGDSCDSSATGVCEKISPRCTREYMPVCGCDMRTYSNKCMARFGQSSKGLQAGISSWQQC